MNKEKIIEDIEIMQLLDTQLFMFECSADMEAMKAANADRQRRGEAQAYGEEQFNAISNKLNEKRLKIKAVCDNYRQELLKEKGE